MDRNCHWRSEGNILSPKKGIIEEINIDFGIYFLGNSAVQGKQHISSHF